MNKLNKNITLSLLGEGGYEALRARWSELCNSDDRKKLNRTHHLLYVALMGRDWRKGFCKRDENGNYMLPITNANKLANGGDMNWGWSRARRGLSTTHKQEVSDILEPFVGLVTTEMICSIREMLPQPNMWNVPDFSVAYPGVSVVEVVA